MSWAYAYQLNPPQPEPRFAKVKALLRRARQAAQRDGRLWTGQMVMEAHITHILVVTDDPHEVRAVDRAIGTELKRQIVLYADELKEVNVFKRSTDPTKFAERVYVDVLS